MKYTKTSKEDEIINLLSEVLKKNNTEGKYDKVLDDLSKTKKNKSTKSKGMAKRPLSEDEFKTIISMLENGFEYYKDGKQKKFRPNKQVAMALFLEANTGLRISDILRLKVKHFQKAKLELHEQKTNKLQYRKLNPNLLATVNRYAIENKLGMEDYIIKCKIRNINNCLEIISNYLGLENIGTHSFRKFYAMYIYNTTKDIKALQTLLNHSSIAITQVYLGTDLKKIDEISSSVDFTDVLNS